MKAIFFEGVANKLLSYVTQKTEIKFQHLSDQCDLIKDLGFDSLERLALIEWCERQFHIAIDCSEMEKISTLGDLLGAIYPRIIPNIVRKIIASNYGIPEAQLQDSDLLENLGGGVFALTFVNEDLIEELGCELTDADLRHATIGDVIQRVSLGY
jgi:acyl carrier protein